uniref:Thiamine pyrimidine synthase n=1 Tax=Pyrodinium bahamense TaxID=73915 RepID=A0A7S0FD86_9DINO
MGASACKGGEMPVVKQTPTIMVGCIDYCDQIRTIWDGMKQYFLKAGVDFDFVLFTSYERQVEALMGGFIDIAWNGPLAHVRTQKRTSNTSLSLGMRDVDCGFVTHIIVRKNAGITDLSGLKDRRLAAGARDSPQACILPMQYLKSERVPLDTLRVTFFDRDLGKHGDTAMGEVEVMNELAKGNFDAGFVSDLMWQRALSSGDVNGGKGEELQILETAKVPLFNHCQFDALSSLDVKKKQDFEVTLFKMDYNKQDDRRIMQLEGIREKWERPAEEGYSTMRDALAQEPNVPFPPFMYRMEEHPFKEFAVA